MKARVLLICVVVSAFAAIARADVVYDPATDWSISNGNPNDVWSYLTGSGDLYTRSGTVTGDTAAGLQWWKKESGDDPCLTYNPTDSELVGWTIHWAPHEIGLGPAGDSNGTILRWTAPTAGSWAVDALFTTIQEGNVGGTIYVTKDGTDVFTHGVGSYDDSSSYSDTLTFAVGETLDFRVNGDKFVRPEITITLIPEPSALLLTASALIGLLAYAWRKRR